MGKLKNKPVVAIVGQPNVGKSTLFNRLVRRRDALVLSEPGVTRDRKQAPASWDECEFLLTDTGGYQPGKARGIMAKVKYQVEHALKEADLILFMVDVTKGVTPVDEEIAELLRVADKPFLVTVNKCDNERRSQEALEFSRLGTEFIFPISASHNLGVGDLMDEVVRLLPQAEAEEEEKAAGIKIAIVGRQNVGKSTLLNTLLGEPRVIVDEEPGTTRDAIDMHIERQGKHYTFIDTAGIRRRGKIERGVEYLSVHRSLRAIERAELCLLLLDAAEGIVAQDAHVAGYCLERRRACILLANKIDQIKNVRRQKPTQERAIRERLHFLNFAPLLFISAKEGRGISPIFRQLDWVYEQYKKRLTTPVLNKFLEQIKKQHAPPSPQGKEIKLKYMTQVSVAPPYFVVFTNHPELLHFSYERFLVNKLRQNFGFQGTPIRISFRKSK